jgi:hypothetical protein
MLLFSPFSWAGTIKATCLIETLPAAFEMHEFLYELRDHSAGEFLRFKWAIGWGRNSSLLCSCGCQHALVSMLSPTCLPSLQA